jgi:gas vesicle protein GvpL/GvpF
VIHLYAFTEAVAALPACTGVAGERVEARTLDDVVAVVGALAAPVAETPSAVLAHGLVVESLAEQSPSVLPARFAEPFADDDSLRSALAPRLAELRRRLVRVRGCVELAVRAMDGRDAPSSGPAGSGRSYMRALASTHAERAAAAESIHRPLHALAAESRVVPPAQGRTVLQASYLVRRGDIGAFADRVEQLAGRHPDLAVVCTGPWAPYSFVEEES